MKRLFILLMSFFILSCASMPIEKNDHQEPFLHQETTTGVHWLAGAAKKIISTEKSVYLAGHKSNRKSRGVHDDIYVRCLVLSNGKSDIGFISLDLLGMLNSDILAIKNRVEIINKKNIIVAFTHTHSAPDTTGLWGFYRLTSGRDEMFINNVYEKASQCLNEAFKNKQPIDLYFFSLDVKLTEFDKDIEKPDSILTFVKGVGENKKTVFTLMNYGFHPHISMHNFYISSDVLDSFYKRMEEEYGGVALFLNGAQGNVDLNIKHKHGDDDWKAIYSAGLSLIKEVEKAEKIKILSQDFTVLNKRNVINVKLQNWRFKLALLLGIIPDFRKSNDDWLLEINYLRLGELEIMTIPGEAFPNIGKDLRKEMKTPYKIICGLCQGAYGYIMYQKDYERYDYHRSMSVGPIGETIRDSLMDLTNPLK